MAAIHHIILCVKSLQRSRTAYGWLMPEVGFTVRMDDERSSGWVTPTSRVYIRAEDPQYANDRFSKDRVGLCELCFAAPSRAAVDALAEALVAHDFTILHPPGEYGGIKGYYAVFFNDPDGLKLEYAHAP